MSGEAAIAAAVFAVDPASLGGCLVRGRAGPMRDAWVARLRSLLPPSVPWQRVPAAIDDAALMGGLDVAASLAAARPVARAGLAARAHGGVLVLPMAERVSPGLAGRLGALLDTGECATQREGLSLEQPARFGLLALDEGGEDEAVPAAVADRLGLHLALPDDIEDGEITAASVEAARTSWRHVHVPDDLLLALCDAARALGIGSLRAPLLAARAACMHAALHGRSTVVAADAAFAARCVLGPRATQCPAPDESDSQPPEPPPQDQAPQEQDAAKADGGELREAVLAAARAVLPAGLLAAAAARQARDAGARSAGASGSARASRIHGRPLGAVRGDPRGGARLHLLQTLRAAAPWQVVRSREWDAALRGPAPRVHVRKDDFHVVRRVQRQRTTTVFAVDASGSSALHRLAEAKGAVELLLAECYVRRDEVAVVAFRGSGADVLLPPTRSLARARRSLAGLPGGGGTPLAAGLAAATEVAQSARRRGSTPLVVVLTDGKANVASDGQPGRERAMSDALAAAGALGRAGLAALVLDTAPMPHPAAQQLATAMGARYLALPHADAHGLRGAVLQAA